MKTIITIILALGLQEAKAASIQVIEVASAKQTSYTSAEFNGFIPYWIVEGQVVSAAKAKELIRQKDAIACASWIMNYSDKSIPKEKLQEQLLNPAKRIALWKVVSGRPIYSDEGSEFALSFVCVSHDAQGKWVEVDQTDFEAHVSGIFSFEVK